MEASALRAPAGLSRRSAPILLRLRSDDQLVALFRLGNEEAFAAIHDRYRTRLIAYARQMLGGSRADAEDALQDVFMRAYDALRADSRPITLRAWLYRVAHNRCIDQLRRPQRDAVELPDNVRALDDPLAEIQRRDDLRRLVADVRRLPEHQRSALLMREMEGLSYAELADALEVTVPAIKSLLVRARISLVEAQDARDTACADIRTDLAGAHDRGVRASGRARRHLRECAGCRDYRAALRGVERGVAALAPAPGPWGLLAKLGGIGGSGAAAGGATAGGGAAAGGTAIIGSAAGAKVAAVVCCAAIVGGGAVKVTEHPPAQPERAKPAPAQRSAPASAPAPSPRAAEATAAAHPRGAARAAAARPEPKKARRAEDAKVVAAAAATEPALEAANGAADGGDEAIHGAQAGAGGVLAPEEEPVATETVPAAEADAAAVQQPPAVAPGPAVVTPGNGSAPAHGSGAAEAPTAP